MKKKYKIVVSDFHMGAGRRLADSQTNYLEDFFFDQEFVELIDYYSEEEWANCDFELILNGDFFEHIQVKPDEPEPDMITERVAMWRQRRIIEGHPEIFEAFRRFNAFPKHRITFNLGNHDAGLLWPGVLTVLREVIGGEVNVLLEPYEFDGVRVEHGHQYHADSAFNKDRYFLRKGLAEPIINLPWGCYFVINYVNRVRRERPYFSRVHPMRYFIRWALIHETLFALRSIAAIIYYFVSLRFTHSRRRHSSFWRTLEIMREMALEANLDVAAKKILLTHPDIKVLVMGHSHGYRYLYLAPDKLYINTGTWTEWLSLDPKNLGRVVRLTYAFIEADEAGHVKASLKEWIGRHQVTRDISFS